MLNNQIKPQALLSTLWIFILLNMILRDLHEFPTEGYVEEMMSLKLSDEVMLLYAFVVEIPILMVLLPRILNDTMNKWINTFAVVVTMLGILSTLPAGDMDDVFFAIVNSIAALAIIIVAWRLPVSTNTQNVQA